MEMREVIIKTDGSCLDNGFPNARGGCAFCVYEKGTGKMIYRRIFKHTIGIISNNRCEMYAFYGALQFVNEHKNIRALMQSDSTTVIEGTNGIARRKANRDLWNLIETIMPEIHDRIIDVEAIDGELENVDADLLAFKAANAIFINEKGEWL